MRLVTLLSVVVPAAALAVFASSARSADSLTPEERARCASRLSMALTGQAASDALLAEADPQAKIDALLADPAFVENFARFINSKFNDDPGANQGEDATYFLAKHILTNNKPWRELFDGKYRVEFTPASGGNPARTEVVEDPQGLGYFRSRPWMVRYAGNEEAGYRLNAAYRIQQNIIGLSVGAVTSAPDADISETGRQGAACRGCHFDQYFALDKVAKVLSKRRGEGDDMTFIQPTEGPQQVLNTTVANEAELVKVLVESTDHQFRTCRLAFEFLYGRPEATCDGALFDACIDAYTQTGDIREALRAIAGDPSYCE